MKTKALPLNLAIIGCGGYAAYLINRMAEVPESCRLTALTTRDPEGEAAQASKANGIAVYKNVDEMLENLSPEECPAIVIPTSIESHFEYTKKALDHGFHVLLEKPPVATVQDIDRLIELQRSSGKWIAVNFQHLFSPITQQLKSRLSSKEFGAVRSVHAQAIWSRPESYFKRSSWSGRLKNNGQWVLDGTVGNPMAHLMAEAVYLAATHSGMASPRTVQAELYHANAIESEDTSAVRIHTEEGVPVFFCTSLCAKEASPVVCEIRTETAQIRLYDFCRVEISFNDGRTELLEPDVIDGRLDRQGMLQSIVHSLSLNERPLITVEECRPYMLAWNGAFESFGVPSAVPSAFIKNEVVNEIPFCCIEGLAELSRTAAANGQLFSEAGATWATPGRIVNMKNYNRFPSFNTDLLALAGCSRSDEACCIK